MAARPYSARFMSGRGASRRETYTVPAGRRVVVRHFSVLFWTTAGQSAMLFVHGISLFYFLAPAANTAAFEEVRFTAYEGETIFVQTAGSDVAYGVDGFLFADDQGVPDDADNVIEHLPLATTLPALPELPEG
jgi:hypothetical protein